MGIFRGAGVAIPTPFKDGKVDWTALVFLVNRLVDNKLHIEPYIKLCYNDCINCQALISPPC